LDITVGYVNLDQTYNPSVAGAIDNIDYSEDRIIVDFTLTAQVGSGFLIEQGGNTFVANLPGLPTSLMWEPGALNALEPGDFTWISGANAGAMPDFSASGGEISFGFLRSSMAGGLNVHGIDNWRVTIHRCP